MFLTQWLRRGPLQTTPNAVQTATVVAAPSVRADTPSGVAPDPPRAAYFEVCALRKAYAGQEAAFTVEARDADDRDAFDYTGTVRFACSDPTAIVPPPFAFTPDHNGVCDRTFVPGAAGIHTLTAIDATGRVRGSGVVKVRRAPAAVRFAVMAMPWAAAGKPTTLAVVAVDADGQTVANYAGTVRFASSDPAAVLPADHTFTPDDRGVFKCRATFATPGDQTVTATDAAAPFVTGVNAVDVG